MKTKKNSTTEKLCRSCDEMKLESDFYLNNGRPRSECKKCTIKRNVEHQKRTESWKDRDVDPSKRRDYMRAYYKKNKDKFRKYRDRFRTNHPDYYRQYNLERKKAAESGSHGKKNHSQTQQKIQQKEDTDD